MLVKKRKKKKEKKKRKKGQVSSFTTFRISLGNYTGWDKSRYMVVCMENNAIINK